MDKTGRPEIVVCLGIMKTQMRSRHRYRRKLKITLSEILPPASATFVRSNDFRCFSHRKSKALSRAPRAVKVNRRNLAYSALLAYR